MAPAKCTVCAKDADQRCAGCLAVYYCSRDHQKQDWKTHKNICKPFQVCFDSTLGRYLKATRLIKQGEVILKERPLIKGPAQVTGPVCLGCGKGFYSQNDCTPCTKCGWPVCNEECEKAVAHKPECWYTIQRGFKVSIKDFVSPHPTYQCLTVLRCLFQRDHNKEKWDRLMQLESHDEARKNTEQYQQDLVLAQLVQKFFKLEDVFTIEDILKVAGIVNVNSHEVPLTEPMHIALYESCSMFEHNCRANCAKSFTATGDILIQAGIEIKPNDHLSICYVDPLWGTINRRHILNETKFFQCQCQRCQDPTEFGTNFNSIKCQACQEKESDGGVGGLLLPKSFTDDPAEWYCNKCENVQTMTAIQKILDHIGRDLEAMEKENIESCRKFVEFYGKWLPTKHYIMTDVRVALAQLIGQHIVNGLVEVGDDQLAEKAKMCQSIVELLLLIAPAEVRLRGTMLFELHATIAEMGRRNAAKGNCGPEVLEAMLLESKKILTESIQLLKHEPDVMPEGKIKIQAKRNLADMEKLICTLHQNVGDAP